MAKKTSERESNYYILINRGDLFFFEESEFLKYFEVDPETDEILLKLRAHKCSVSCCQYYRWDSYLCNRLMNHTKSSYHSGKYQPAYQLSGIYHIGSLFPSDY
jgi:hypothetical protein